MIYSIKICGAPPPFFFYGAPCMVTAHSALPPNLALRINGLYVASHRQDPFMLRQLSGFWVGLHRESCGNFSWTDGSPLDYIYWADNEPTDCQSQKHCVHLQPTTWESAVWKTISCETELPYICTVV